MSDVVTGEAVRLELRLAKLPSRALALLIDLAIMLTAGFLLLAVFIATVPALDEALAVTIFIVTVVLTFVGYPVTIETLTRGRSGGKLAMGLRVVRDDGGPIRFRHALTRGLAGFIVDFVPFFGAVAVITSLLSKRGKRVGDMLAGTIVLRERLPVGRPHPDAISMPYPLAGWASALELSRLPDDLALVTRQFLLRTRQLTSQAREATAARLAAEVAERVAPAPPPGTPAEVYLAAVVAERRRRELARITGPGQAAGPVTGRRVAAQPGPSVAIRSEGVPPSFDAAPAIDGEPVGEAAPPIDGKPVGETAARADGFAPPG